MGSSLLLVALMIGQSQPSHEAKPATIVQRPAQAPREIYSQTADAGGQIASAVNAAAVDDIRVLINWGANDSERCTRFAQVQRAPEISDLNLLSDEYKVVTVDVGHGDRNLAAAQKYGGRIKVDELPYLTILDKAGKVFAEASSQEFASKEDSNAFEAKKVAAFLVKYKAQPPEMQPLLNATLTAAKRDNKYVFLWFSAPW